MRPASIAAIARGLSFAAYDFARQRLGQLPAIWYHIFRPTKLAKEEYWAGWRAAKSMATPPDAG
jgi:hypothetical protein